MKKRILFILAAISLVAVYAAPVELTKAVIVIPEKPVYTVEFAVKELQYHVEKSTGVKLPVLSESEALPAGPRIYMGATAAAAKAGLSTEKFAPAEYMLKTIGGDLYLLGKDRSLKNTVGSHWNGDWEGTLLAVYDLLEKNLGVRWLWPGELGEVIPARKSIVIDDLDRSGKPFFDTVRFSFIKEDPKVLLGWSSERNRAAYYKDQDLFLLRHRIRSNMYYNYGHAFADYWKRFHESHPEYFALLPNGKRQPLEGDPTGKYISMCVSQAAFHKQIVNDWQKNPERKPDHIPYRPLVNVCENDVPGMCVCDACRAWDAPDPGFAASPYWALKPDGHPLRSQGRFVGLAKTEWGEDGVLPGSVEPPSVSDRYAKFYLAVQAEARKVDPAAAVIGYAYANYRKPPKEVKLNDDVVIIYVPNIFFPYTAELSRTYQQELHEWRKQGVTKFYYRPNYMHAGANTPVLFTRQIAEDIRFAARNGAIGTYFDSLTGAWAVQGPMLYTLSRIQFDPERSLESILDEYYSGFGKASREVRAYFDYWTKRSDAVTPDEFRKYCIAEKDARGNYGGTFKNFVKVTPHLFPPESLAKGRQLLRAAERAAAGDLQVLARIEFLKKGLKDTELTIATRIAQKAMEVSNTPANKAAFQKAFDELAAYRASIEKDNVCNYSHIARWEKSGSSWPWEYVKLPEK